MLLTKVYDFCNYLYQISKRMISHPVAIDHSVWARELVRREPILLEKIQQATSSDPAQAKILLVETLRFLHLVAFYQRKLTPSLAVDLAWHEFILFTRQYAAFCQTTFGRFIHHSPGGKDQENHRNFERTIQLYQQAWGAPPAEVWGKLAVALYEEAQCGSCLATSLPGEASE